MWVALMIEEFKITNIEMQKRLIAERTKQSPQRPGQRHGKKSWRLEQDRPLRILTRGMAGHPRIAWTMFGNTRGFRMEPSHHKWRIAHDSTGTKVTIGYVEAPDQDSAIDEAIGKFNIDPRLAGKLIAEKIKTSSARTG
jgi:hypothetical protein